MPNSSSWRSAGVVALIAQRPKLPPPQLQSLAQEDGSHVQAPDLLSKGAKNFDVALAYLRSMPRKPAPASEAVSVVTSRNDMR